jgi:hypothetical protein
VGCAIETRDFPEANKSNSFMNKVEAFISLDLGYIIRKDGFWPLGGFTENL